ncbi:MAG: MoaD/ThiS family protein [Thermoplasmata archaeon]|nr:MoaD/ThiS family protein [Thermoplasmata archaeon]
MKVKLELFSVYRGVIGDKEIEIEIKSNARIKDVIQLLINKCPSLKKFIKYAIFSINREYADENSRIRKGDTIAIFAPIGGG